MTTADLKKVRQDCFACLALTNCPDKGVAFVLGCYLTALAGATSSECVAPIFCDVHDTDWKLIRDSGKFLVMLPDGRMSGN